MVYHARYVAFLERARTEWMRSIGHDQQKLRDHEDLVFAVRAMRVDFRAPARLDDLIDVSVSLVDCRRASAVFVQSIRCRDTLLLDAEVRVAALNGSDFRPRGIPPSLYDQLKSLETSVE